MRGTTTSWWVAGIGSAVTALGSTIFKNSRLGAGIMGFGLAHVVLGILDRLRPSIRQ